MTLTALFVTNNGNANGWAIVIAVCIVVPVVVGLALRWRDRPRQ
jgi:hypothetical protein